MKIYSKIVVDIETDRIIHEVAEEYFGKLVKTRQVWMRQAEIEELAGWTNRFKYVIFDTYLRGAAIAGAAFQVFLATSAQAPSPDFNVKTEMTEIATSADYVAGGLAVNRDSTDWDVLTEDDGNDWALCQIKDLVWTGTAGAIPTSGNGARYAVLTDRHATPASRLILAMWDLSSDRQVSQGQTLTLQNLECKITD